MRWFGKTARTKTPGSCTRQAALCVGKAKHWFFIHQLSANREPTAERIKDQTGSRSGADKQRCLEAALFLSSEPQSSRKLAKLAGLADATEARTLIRQINHALDTEGRPYRVEEVAGGYVMMTRPQFAPWLQRLSHVPAVFKLSQSALETLAVVAYRQPVLRANVEAIRGVGSSEMLKQLMELDLVRISGRSEELGRPYLYGTTRRFLQMFGLRSADRLPRIDWVNATQVSESIMELAELDSESKESTVKKSYSATALLEKSDENVDTILLQTRNTFGPSAAKDDDEDAFEEDDVVEEEDDFEDDDDWDDEVEADDDAEADADADAEEDEDDLDEDEAGWEEVDDDDEDLEEDEDDDEDIDDDDEDDDWEDDDDDEDDWD